MIISTLSPTLVPGPVDLPCEFKYKPFILKKRIKTKMANKGSFTQKMLPLFLPGIETLDWEIELTTLPIAKQLTDWYNLDDTFTFTGNLGEEYLIEFSELDFQRKGGFMVAKGKFRVICIVSELNPTFECDL